MPATHQFHHLGILTRCLEDTARLYVDHFHYRITRPVLHIEEPDISVCSLEHPEAPRIELIQPEDHESTLGRLASKGSIGYHLAWSTDSLDNTLRQFHKAGYRHLPVFTSPLWNQAPCCFSIAPDGSLVEFVEI